MSSESTAPIEDEAVPAVDDIANGVAVAVALIAASGVLFVSEPPYFGHAETTLVVGALFAAFGLVGLSFELNKLGGSGKGWGLDNLGVGVSLLVLWGLQQHFLPRWWTNLASLPFLVLGSYGVIYGCLLMALSIRGGMQSRTAIVFKLVMLIPQALGAVLAGLNILRLLGFLHG